MERLRISFWDYTVDLFLKMYFLDFHFLFPIFVPTALIMRSRSGMIRTILCQHATRTPKIWFRGALCRRKLIKTKTSYLLMTLHSR